MNAQELCGFSDVAVRLLNCLQNDLLFRLPQGIVILRRGTRPPRLGLKHGFRQKMVEYYEKLPGRDK